MQHLTSRLRGTGVAIITPFNLNLSVDYTALKNIIEYVLTGGVEYIVVLGTTGETPVLSLKEKIDILHAVYEQVNNRIPVVVGVGGNNTAEVIKDLSNLPLQGAIAILSAAPYYNKPSQEGIYQHYKAIAEVSTLPVILYNVPGRTGRNIETKTTVRLANEMDNIIGIKEASGDIVQCMDLIKHCPPDFMIVSGDDNLVLPQIACGMTGVISVAANAFPSSFSTMTRHCLAGEFASARKINEMLMPTYELLFAENNPAGIKAFMTELNLIENNLRLPLVPLSERYHNEIRQYLANLPSGFTF
jgi:4-hydroxy-tetrahydrodipicolinate synthase